jgi:hypothetical protein
METQKPPSEELLDLLVEEGAVASADADSVRTRHRDTWIPLGKILRQKGWLTMGQLVEILQLQAQYPSLRLGDIVVERGHCTRAQLAEALRTQRDLSPHVLELLESSTSVEPEKLLRAVTRYVRALEARIPASSPGDS